MPLIPSSYRAPWWLPGGHAQTIVPATLAPLPAVAYRRERWTTPDDDCIDVDFAQPEPASVAAPLLLLLHGLEGSARSHYALSLMRAAADRGWRGLVAHFRGCSGEPNLRPRAYHSGDSDEADWILRRLHARWPQAPLYAAGVSLGGNVLAKWAGERGSDARFVAAAAAVGAPLDLTASGAALGRGFARLYARMFLRTLRAKALAMNERFPGLADAAALRACADLHAFDDAFTAPLHGFRDADDYWRRASAGPLLHDVRIPLLLLNARNDPFVPAASLPGAADVAAEVRLEQPAQGGHIGFAQGPPPGRLDFLPQRLLRFFADGA